ncbi:uncharacterized protein PADG_12150 [Paracoccidioides brasiliensis Pb18]|uniref:RNase H type-1 domain-containing protein n=1 Tax=Paracoccidioides brasiliensis (strain Pb18) TaxID=502780 RepID=A0A0A0HWC5_PARBD|nr:uncharacterized protein PADG_12150 [Paracoccidioides brasiliensis Pb18]KGM91695.1 hypothetical protein PADG_12150 [Paracoccidioides brasiliensis Pb18]
MDKAEVFDVEAMTALQSLKKVITSPQTRYISNVYICLDNLEVVQVLGSVSNTSHQPVFVQFLEVIKAWQSRDKLLLITQNRMIIR